MKIVFATKNHQAFLQELLSVIEESEANDELSIPSIIPGMIQYKDGFDSQMIVESNVRDHEVFIISGMMDSEFMEAIDLADYCISTHCKNVKIIFPSPCWRTSSSRETNPMKNRLDYLDFYANKHQNMSWLFMNPESVVGLQENEFSYSDETFYSFFDEINPVGDVVLFSVGGDVERIIPEQFHVDVVTDVQQTSNKRVVMFLSMMNESNWNEIASEMKNAGCNEIYVFIVHCPPINKSIFSPELFEQIFITDSWFNSHFNCLGEDGFQMKSILPTIHKIMLK